VPLAPAHKVEHAFARLGRWRRLSRCYEGTEASARAWLEVVCVAYLFARLRVEATRRRDVVVLARPVDRVVAQRPAACRRIARGMNAAACHNPSSPPPFSGRDRFQPAYRLQPISKSDGLLLPAAGAAAPRCAVPGSVVDVRP
jgi:hypothetical protein